jgi:hypothetical protein
MSPARQSWWKDKLLNIAVLLFGAGVAWGTLKLDARITQDRQIVDHVQIDDHETAMPAWPPRRKAYSISSPR